MSINLKVGGVLDSIEEVSTGKKWDLNVRNTVVDQGMLAMLQIPAENPNWSSDLTLTGYTDRGSAVLGGFAFTESGANICPHLGLFALCACGTGQSATATTMTDLQSPVSADGFKGYGAALNSYAGVSGANTERNSQLNYTTYTFTYVYKAPETFDCYEVGIYSAYPKNSMTGTVLVQSFTPSDLLLNLFARVSLMNPITYTAGNVYKIKYTFKLSREYSNTLEETSQIFGLPAMLRKRFYMYDNKGNYSPSYNHLAINSAGELVTYTQSGIDDTKSINAWSSINFGSNIPCNLPKNTTQWNTELSAGSFSVFTNTPKLYWLTSWDGSYSTYCTPAHSRADATSYLQAGEVVGFDKPEAVVLNGDTAYSIATYTYTKPYGADATKYCSIYFGNWVWFVNTTSDTKSTIGLDCSTRKFTLTLKTTITRG